MKKILISSVLILVCLIGSIFNNNVFAADTITLNDISGKKPGDSITMSGTSSLDEVSILVIRPDTTKLYFNVVPGGDFSDTIVLPEDAPAGTYTVEAGKGEVKASKTFTVTANSNPQPGNPPSSGTQQPSNNNTATINPSPDGSVKITPPAPVVDTSKAKATTDIDESTINKALASAKENSDGAKTLHIDIPKVAGIKNYSLNLPVNALASSGVNASIEIKTEFGTVVLPSNMLQADANTAKTVQLSIQAADTSALSPENKAIIGDRPVLDLSINAGGSAIKWNNPDRPVTVNVPYDAGADELKNPQFIKIWYIDDEGKREIVNNSSYNSEKKQLEFTVTHFSRYAVGYNMVKFSDIREGLWMEQPVVALASYELISGTSATTFSPDKKITRGEYLGWLVRILGLDSEAKTNFSDISKDYKYYNEIGIAKELKITSGTANNNFRPDTDISRQDMAVLTIKAIKAAERKIAQGAQSDLAKFTDRAAVSKYAAADTATMVKAGYIVGNNNAINPKGNTTRAQAAQILYKIFASK